MTSRYVAGSRGLGAAGACIEYDTDGVTCLTYASTTPLVGATQNVPIPAGLLGSSCPWYQDRSSPVAACTFPSTAVVLIGAGALLLILVTR